MLDGKIILVDDNEAVLKTLKMILAREFKTVVGVSVPTFCRLCCVRGMSILSCWI